MKAFTQAYPVATRLSNHDLVQDFLDLSFALESGRPLAVFTRIEGPVRLRVNGDMPAAMTLDLNRLLARLRHEAGIDIRRAAPSETAQITINPVSRADIRRYLPQSACFIAPNVSTLEEYARARRRPKTAWSQLKHRDRIAIFVPDDTSPQEMRDCLHEELAQALGPLNDMYRLSDSVFNDDNVHTVLTGFDMTILRAYYAPELHSGMTRDEVAQRLPDIFRRISPENTNHALRKTSPTPRNWIDAIQTALGPGAGHAKRRKAAQLAIEIAARQGWTDHRRGFSHYAYGRTLLDVAPQAAHNQFLQAQHYFNRQPEYQLYQAYTAGQIAGYTLAQGRGADTLQIVTPHLKTAARFENAALLATLMLLRAEALELTGDAAAARQLRLDSAGWARYGFGSDWAVRAKMREIAAIPPAR